jgi:Chaperone of endosialidase
MNQQINLKTTTLTARDSISSATAGRDLLLIALALAWFTLSPAPKAFGVSPAPDGGYPNGNTAEGTGALSSLTSGSYNTALGLQSLFSDTSGGYNTGTGVNALYNNTGGTSNTATGVNALYSNTTASYNTANGVNALYSNTSGTYNTATGQNALYSNTTGTQNTANGDYALTINSTGGYNTAIGVGAMFSNTTGGQNTANGDDALYNNTTGSYNTANGDLALYSNTTGATNTANGFYALVFNTTGSNNIGLGYAAGYLLTTGSNNIDIGNNGVAGEANTIRIGISQTATYIAGISGATASGGAAVFVNSSGQLGTLTSSRRFKQEIKPMDKASEAILALRPVSFRYKQEIDPKGIPQFGLVAEEVEQVNPDLVVRDAEGKVYTVRYEAVNAMLLNEFLKEHRTVQELKSTAAKQEATIAKQQKQIEALTAGLQKVSNRLEVGKTAPRIVADNQ